MYDPGVPAVCAARGFPRREGARAMFGRKNVVIAVAVLALGVAGVAIAGVSSKSSAGATATKVTISVLDGKLTLTPTSLPAGKVILVVSNKGKMTHGLAIMGETM